MERKDWIILILGAIMSIIVEGIFTFICKTPTISFAVSIIILLAFYLYFGIFKSKRTILSSSIWWIPPVWIVSSIAFIVIFPIFLQGASTSFVLSGKFLDQDDNPALSTLISIRGTPISPDITNEGIFSIPDFPTGDFDITYTDDSMTEILLSGTTQSWLDRIFTNKMPVYNIHVSSSSDEMADPLPTPTKNPTQVPSTPIPTPLPTESTPTPRAPCIRAEENLWYPSWTDPSDSPRCPNLISCFDYSERGFVAQYEEDTNSYGLHIQCGSGISSVCDYEDVSYGVFFYPEDNKYIFNISLSDMRILQSESDFTYQDVDLVIGVGDPFAQNGKFLFLRMVEPGNSIHVCILSGFNLACSNPIYTLSLGHSVQNKVFEIDILSPQITFSLDGVVIQEPFSINEGDPKIWIGYNFRSRGAIDAYIGFPDSLQEYLTVPDNDN